METEPPDEVVCPNCGELTPNGEDFCAHCGGPLSAYAVLDPYKRIPTAGQMYRQAAGQAVTLPGLIAIWLIFLAIVIVPLRWILQAPSAPRDIWVPILGWLVCGYVVYRVTRSYVTHRPIGQFSDEEAEKAPKQI